MNISIKTGVGVCRNPQEEYKILEIFDKSKCQIISIADPLDRDSASGRIDRYAATVSLAPPKPDPLISKHRRLKVTRDRLAELYAEGFIDKHTFLSRIEEADKEAANIAVSNGGAITVKEACEYLENITDGWKEKEVIQKRQLLQLLEVQITVNTGKRPLWIELSTSMPVPPVTLTKY